MLHVHRLKTFPEEIDKNTSFSLKIDVKRRKNIEKNHSVTHLMHEALRRVLGEHIEQKGSLVEGNRLRFDFSHFQKD